MALLDTRAMLLGGVATIIMGSPAMAQAVDQPAARSDKNVVVAPASTADIIVTGSRIQNGDSSPTPVTIVKTELLESISPATIADGLNKLPQFVGSNTQTTNNNADSNNVGNFLNLRNLGTTRNLILFDGHRLPDTAKSGGVDINTIPQFLLERVDVVTGGASAIYGSDAVSGVINFVVDRKFTGFKVMAEAGIAELGDNGTQRLGIGYGADIMGGRGHILVSYNFANSGGIDSKTSRKTGALVPSLSGTGTAADPYRPILNARTALATNNGLIQSGPFAFGAEFGPGGTLVPADLGTPVGPGAFSGGNGYFFDTGLLAALKTHQGYGRFDYDLVDDVAAYVQGSYTRSSTNYPFIQYLLPGQLVFSDNPYLAPSTQAALLGAGVPAFAVGKSLPEYESINASTTSYFINGGLRGKIADDRFSWDISYTNARTTERTATLGNVNNAKLAAALDAVQTPGGQIVCRISQTNPTRFPGCIPLNLFGPGSVTPEALDFITDDTKYRLVQKMDNLTATFSGSLVDLPAGPLQFALNAEYRKNTLNLVSNAQPLDRADCTGLTLNCTPGVTSEYQFNVVANSSGKQTVKEGAIELNVPLLKDKPFFHTLSISGAARYTHYDTSGGVTTWKIGGDWAPIDGLRLRATRSRDIRAPNLNELFGPTSTSPIAFADVHVEGGGAGQGTVLERSGNPNLRPEKADTLTAGIVYQPSWLPRLSIAVDYYDIKISDAISSIDYSTANAVCEASGGTDPLCDLIIRPFPFSNRTAANFPTKILQQPVNAAGFRQSGIDTEINYSFPVFTGTIGIRGLVTYVDRLTVKQFPAAPALNYAGKIEMPRWRASLITGYSDDNWTITAFGRFRSSVSYDSDPRVIFDVPKVKSAIFVDTSIGRKVQGLGGEAEIYLSIQNLFNKTPPIRYNTPGAPGFFFPGIQGDDFIGRRFNVGFRARF